MTVHKKIEEILREVSKNCLKGQEVPVFLQELWKDQLKGYCFIQEREYGELTLVSSYGKDFFYGYDAEFIGDKRIAKIYSKMFEEIAFIGVQADDSLIGYWLYKPGLSILNAPVLSLDNEGMFHLEGNNLQNYFVIKCSLETGNKINESINRLQNYLQQHNLPQANSVAFIELTLKTFPDPEKRFDEYFNAVSDE